MLSPVLPVQAPPRPPPGTPPRRAALSSARSSSRRAARSSSPLSRPTSSRRAARALPRCRPSSAGEPPSSVRDLRSAEEVEAIPSDVAMDPWAPPPPAWMRTPGPRVVPSPPPPSVDAPLQEAVSSHVEVSTSCGEISFTSQTTESIRDVRNLWRRDVVSASDSSPSSSFCCSRNRLATPCHRSPTAGGTHSRWSATAPRGPWMARVALPTVN